MHSISVIMLAFVLLALQSTFAHLVPWDMFVPSLSLPIVLYMGLHDYSAGHGVILSFAVGYLMDVFAGSPMGLYTFVAVAIFLVCRVAALRLFLQGWIFEVVVAFLLALLASMIVLVIRALFDKDFGSLLIHLEIVVSRAMAVSVISPFLFRLVAWLERTVPRRRRGEGRVIID